MGAVAALLYAIKQHSVGKEKDNIEISPVQALVLDSPFSNFRQIAKTVAAKKFSLPGFIV